MAMHEILTVDPHAVDGNGTPSAQPPGPRRVPTQYYVSLPNVPWRTYEDLLKSCDTRPYRLTYDRGVLEIMTVSSEHELEKTFLTRLVEAMAEELDMDLIGLGQTTWKREDLDKGLEADECYYLRAELPLQNRARVDLSLDPPPDLAIEVEITCSAMNRMAIYAAIRVPEVWRFDGQILRFFRLQGSEYVQIERSLAFPWVTANELMAFLGRHGSVRDTQLIKEFRQWVRETVLPRKTHASHDQL
jgi:Uma2 family endonuclease